MPDINKANRQVCDVLFCDVKTKKPYLKFDTANTTTAGIEGDSVYAMAKGSRKIAFANPLTATMSIEAQVYPFKLFSLFTDGVIDTEAMYAETKTVKATEEGKLTLTSPTAGTIETGYVFAYPADAFGDEDKAIAGTFNSDVFTETTSSEASAKKIKKDSEYTVCYIVKKTAVKKISFRNDRLPKDYYVTMSTLDKDEEGRLTPFKIVAYKATAQRNFELSFTSEGDPATVTATLIKWCPRTAMCV